MNIILRNRYRAEITLSPDEMDRLDITYDGLDYASPDTRRVISILLKEIEDACGIDIDPSGKLLIEAMREGEYCRLCFTSLPPKNGFSPSVKQLVKPDERPLAFRCCSIDGAVNAAVLSGFSGKSALYERNGNYLLLFFADEKEKQRLFLRLAEYGDVCAGIPEKELACCREHWNLAEGTEAVKKLSLLA